MSALTRLRDARVRLWPWAAAVATTLAIAGVSLLGRSEPVAAQATTSAAARMEPAERAAIEAVVREYILANPEIIPQAITALQSREVGKLLDSNRAEIETPFASAWAGAKDGDVTLVEFYDFGCPYCRAAKADVARLIAEDKRLKVVYRDLPVLSEASREAAIASLSAAQQGRHAAFYNAMFDGSGRVSHEKVVATVRRAGLSEIRTARDLAAKANTAEIEKNLELGRALGISGTPSYVVGDRILTGAVGYEALKEAVSAARTDAAAATSSAAAR